MRRHRARGRVDEAPARPAAATYPDDESGDAYKFTVGLAKLCEAKGVKFEFGVAIEGFSVQNGKITAVRTQDVLNRSRRLRPRPRQLQPAARAPAGHRPADLSAQGLLGDDAGQEPGGGLDRVALGRGAQAGPVAAGRPAAHRRHRRVERLQHGNQQGALRGDREARDGTVSRAPATRRRRPTGPGCGRRRRATCPASAARSIRTSSSTPATARSAGPTPAAPGASLPTSSAAGQPRSRFSGDDGGDAHARRIPWPTRSMASPAPISPSFSTAR